MKNVFMKTEKILKFKSLAIFASSIAIISFSTCANAASEEWKITSPATMQKDGQWLVVSYNKS